MTEKIIDEVMGLVRDRVLASIEIQKSNSSDELRSSYQLAMDAEETIRAKLREVLERRPLTDEEIAKATRCDMDDPIFMIAKGFVQAGERAHNIGAEQ